MSLKTFDNQPPPNEDSYETPPELYERLQEQYEMNFQLDAAAVGYNSKCPDFLASALFQEWNRSKDDIVDVWCNPPHSMNEEFIRRAELQHIKHNINIVMIIPANVVGTKTWHELIENETTVFRENHPVKGRPKFLKHGRQTKHPSRNSYVSIVWRRKHSVVGYLEGRENEL